MLPDSPDVEDVVLGAAGVKEGLRTGGLLMDMSTVAPATARRLHEALGEHGVEALDAPCPAARRRPARASSRSWSAAATRR